MSRVVLVTGGSRSGKSGFAESLLNDYDDVLYLATSIITDSEMEDRVKRHKESRNQNWETHEGYTDLYKAIESFKGKHALLDCITVLTTNIMFDREWDFDNLSREDFDTILSQIKEELRLLISKCREKGVELVIVTNEVGYGLVPEYKLGRIFRDMAGFINQYVSSLSDEVYLVACGLPLKLK